MIGDVDSGTSIASSAWVALLGNTARRSGARTPKEDQATEALTNRLEEIATAAQNPEDAVEPALDAITEATEATASAICFFDQRQQLLRLAAERGLSDEGCKSLRHVRRGLLGSWDMPLQSLNNRRAYVIQNASQNRYVPPLIDDPKAMRTVACLPLFAASTPVGSLVLVSTAARGFSDAQLQSLDKASKTLGRIIEAVRARATRLTPTAAGAPEILDREQFSREDYEAARISPSATPAEQGAPGATGSGDRFAEAHVEESLAHKLAQARREVERATDQAREWERKHQELAGELAAAAAREQRLRGDLTATAGQLQSLSSDAPTPDAKTGAAHMAETARLQASVAEAESIAARERLRASDIERKLSELTTLLQDATEREDELRRRLDSGDLVAGDGSTPRSESAQVARLRARITDLEATLAAERSRVATLEETHADLAGKLGESEAAEKTYREGFQTLAAEFEIRTTDLQTTLQAEHTRFTAKLEELGAVAEERTSTVARLEADLTRLTQDLAATSAREHTLADELGATRQQHQGHVRELEERESARLLELDDLRRQLADAEGRAERLAIVEAARTQLAEELDAATRARATTEQDHTRALAGAEARIAELSATVEREQARATEWEQRHAALETELAAVADRERARLDAALTHAEQDEAVSHEQAARVAELQELRTRLAEVEAAAARATARSGEWEARCASLDKALDDERAQRRGAEAQLESLRTASVEHEQDDVSRHAERTAVAERVYALETDAAEAKRAAAEALRRSEQLAAELETATARAEAVEREFELLQANLAHARADAEGARAAAVAHGDSALTRLSESEARIQSLTDSLGRAQDTIEQLQVAEQKLRQEMQARDHELGHARERLEAATREVADHAAKLKELSDAEARARELDAQLQAMRSAMAEAIEEDSPAPASVAPARATASAAAAKPRPAPSAGDGASISRIAVIDATDRWRGVAMHGVEVLPVEPGADLQTRVPDGAGNRLLVNLASTSALDTLVAARAAGVTTPACGFILTNPGDRALPLGFVEVAALPVDTDQVLQMLSPFFCRGTRMLIAGSDADVFISLRQALSRAGASVSMAWDGKQATDLLAMVSPEVVVIDLDLPPKSGLDLITRLPADTEMPVVAVIPGQTDSNRNAALALANPSVTGSLVSLDRLLEHVRRLTRRPR